MNRYAKYALNLLITCATIIVTFVVSFFTFFLKVCIICGTTWDMLIDYNYRLANHLLDIEVCILTFIHTGLFLLILNYLFRKLKYNKIASIIVISIILIANYLIIYSMGMLIVLNISGTSAQ